MADDQIHYHIYSIDNLTDFYRPEIHTGMKLITGTTQIPSRCLGCDCSMKFDIKTGQEYMDDCCFYAGMCYCTVEWSAWVRISSRKMCE